MEVKSGLFNREGARKYLGGISERTLTELVALKQIKAIYIGRRCFFTLAALEAFAKRGTTSGYRRR